jgi:hypothetical protein
MDGFDMEYFINLGFGVLSFIFDAIGGEPRLTISWIPGISFYVVCIDAEKSLWRDLVAMGCNGIYFVNEDTSGYVFRNKQSYTHFCWLTGLPSDFTYYDYPF